MNNQTTQSFLKDIRTEINKADLILILIIILVCASSFFFIMSHKDYDRIEVYVDNDLYIECELDKNQVVKINEHNTIEIKDKKVRMLYSDCKNQQCVKMGWSDQFPIICVPNKVSIKFKNLKSKEHDKMIISY
jgi:hypothetical protein